MDETGPLGLPYTEAGQLMQALGQVLVDREHDRQTVIDALQDADEAELWETLLGPFVDRFAEALGLPAYPEA